MMIRFWLIAEREFRAYATTASFWVALVMGPLLMMAAAGAAALASAPTAPAGPIWAITVESADPELAQAARASLAEAAALNGARVTSDASGGALVLIERAADGQPQIHVTRGSLEPTAVALLRRDLAAPSQDRAEYQQAPPKPAAPPVQASDQGARFGLMMILWLTLTGSLGMLLQAIVRERANRALESLLASARPTEIIFGKLAGVGAVSLLVLGAWLGAAGFLAGGAIGGDMVKGAFGAVSNPGLLLNAGLIYVLAYGMYGAAMITLGSIARDLPSAQNLSRPVFGVLVVVFFTAMAMAAGAAPGLQWLVYVPPFTPFLLLIDPPGPGGQALALALMLAATVACGWLAARCVSGARISFSRA